MIYIEQPDGTEMILPQVDRVYHVKSRYYIVPDASVPELQFDITKHCFYELRRCCINSGEQV